MPDVEGRGDAGVAEDRDALGGFEDVGGGLGVGDVDEDGFIEDRIESRAHRADSGLVLEPGAVDR